MLGAGGHAYVLADILKQLKKKLSGLISPSIICRYDLFANIPHYLSDDSLLEFDSQNIQLVNGVGTLPGKTLRTKLYIRFIKLGYDFKTIIAPTAIISPYAELGDGVQIMHGAIIQAGAKIGDNTIVNTGAIVEHNCIIGSHNHIAPGVTLSGQVQTADFVHIGTGANIIQCISVGENAVIGAGAVITKDVPAGYTAYSYKTKLIKNKV